LFVCLLLMLGCFGNLRSYSSPSSLYLFCASSSVSFVPGRI
jgi:hypothetical protein